MATRYWVGGTGPWDATTTHWSATSGGAGGASVPTATDDVVFNSLSNLTAYTCTLTTTPTCASITIAGPAAGNVTIAGSAAFSIYGGLSLPSTGITWTSTSAITFRATTTGFTINTNGINITNALTFNGVGGGWTLGAAISCGVITLTNGTLNTSASNYNITSTGTITTAIGTKSLILNASTVNITTFNNAAVANFTLNAGTSQINCSAPNLTFAGGLTFYNVSFTSSAITTVTISGANTFNTLSFAGKSAVGISYLNITANQTINGTFTISAPTTIGSSRYFVSSGTLGTSIIVTASAVSFTDVDFLDINNTGTAWTGTRLGDCGGNTGITFPASKTVYWNLAGSQNWSATGWATTQTGTPALANFPLAQDIAIFTNTAPVAGSTISITSAYNLPTINFSTRSNTLTFATSTSGPQIYGDLTLSTAITVTGSIAWTYQGRNKTQTITTAGITIGPAINISAIGGTVVLADAYNTPLVFTLAYGTLSSNYNITCLSFSASGSNTRVLSVTSGQLYLTGTGNVFNIGTNTGLTISAITTVNITSTGSTAISVNAGNSVGISDQLNFNFSGGTYALTFITMCNSVNFTGFSGTLVNSGRSIKGDLTLSAGMSTVSGANITIFSGVSAIHNITSNECFINFPVTLIGAGGSFILLDDTTIVGYVLTHTNGTLNLNGNTITLDSYITTGGTKNITFNGGTLKTNAFNNAVPLGFTTTAGTGVGTINVNSPGSAVFYGGGSTYNCTVNLDSPSWVIYGSNTFDNLTNSVTLLYLTFETTTTNNFKSFNINGTSGNLVSVRSNVSGIQANLNYIGTGSYISCDYLVIQDLNVT